MKTPLKILLTLLIISVSFPVFAQSQAELNSDALLSYQKADKELNQVYNKILKEYSTDTAFINNLRVSQRIWITFRDAEVKMKYPDEYEYGTVYPLCVNAYLERLTVTRTKHLKKWLIGEQEGEVCSGSIKIKE